MSTGELLTARLVLARPRPEDADGVLAVLSDPRTVEHNPSDRVDDLEVARALVARWIQHWEDNGFGYWCVFESGSSTLAGVCGTKRMTVHGHAVLNLKYRFGPERWGQGYATEAAAAVLAWVGEQQPGQRHPGSCSTREPRESTRRHQARPPPRPGAGRRGRGRRGLGVHEPVTWRGHADRSTQDPTDGLEAVRRAAPADVVGPLFTDHGRHTGSEPAVARPPQGRGETRTLSRPDREGHPDSPSLAPTLSLAGSSPSPCPWRARRRACRGSGSSASAGPRRPPPGLRRRPR